MMIPKIEKTPKKEGQIIYPDVSTWDIYREYWKLARPYWPVVLLTFLCVVTTLTGSIVAPIYYKKFFDTLTSATPPIGDLNPLLSTVIFIFLLNLVSWYAYRLSWLATNYLEAHVLRDAARNAFDYLLKHSHTFFISTFAGSLVQRINRFSRAFLTLYDRIMYDILMLVLKVIGAEVVLYIIHPLLAYAMGVWIVLFLLVSYFLTRFKLKYDIEASATVSRLTGALSDSISNHGSVQFFSGYKEEARRVGEINNRFLHLNWFRWSFGNVINGVQALLGVIIEFIIFFFGVRYWNEGLITLGTFVLLHTYIIVIENSLWNFGRVVREVYEGLADAKEMVEIIHLKHEIVDVPGAKELKITKGDIQYKDIQFYFGKDNERGKQVFDNLNVKIKAGEKVAIIGPSGAGKSTLVKLLLRLHDIQGGQILVDDQDISKVTQDSLRNNISLVPQDPVLFHRTLMENIRYGRRDATDAEVIEAAKLAHCDVFINEFPHKYETYVGERGVKLSGGERQRVAIARAILKNAPILILDEATSSLDSHSESLIQDALNTLMKGKTTIVIAHRLSTIRNMDRIIVVSKGGVEEEGPHDELIKKEGGIYAKLWKLQAGGFSNKSIEELLEV
jgi:ATP-binding cassette, subfamily B, bacterial